MRSKKIFLPLLGLFALLASITAHAQTNFEMTNNSSCTYDFILDISDGASTVATSTMTVADGDSYPYTVPASFEVVRVHVLDATGGSNNATVAPSSTTDNVGDCSGMATDDVEWISNQQAVID